MAQASSAVVRVHLDPGYALSTARAVVVDGPLATADVRRALAAVVADRPELGRSYTVDGAVAGDAAGPEPVVEPAGSVTEALALAVEHATGLGTLDLQPGLRSRLYRIREDRYVLFVAAHPAAVDHAAMSAMYGRLSAALLGLANPPAQTAAADRAPDWPYWTNRLAGELPVVDLTGDAGPPPRRAGRPVPVPVPAEAEVAGEAHALAALGLLVRRYTGISDVLIGLPLTGAAAATTGARESNAVVRLDVTGTVADLVAAAATALADARTRPVPPFEDLTRRLGAVHDVNRWPLFQISAVLDTLVVPDSTVDEEARAFALGDTGHGRSGRGLTMRPCALPRCWLPGELELVVSPRGLTIVVPESVPDRFPSAVAEDLRTVLAASTGGGHVDDVLTEPAVARVSAPRPARRHRSVPDRSAFDGAESGTLASRFLDAATRWPDRPAVLGDDGDRRTYRDLALAAGGIARALGAAGHGPGDRVGLLLDHGGDLVAAILGTLIAGCCYVPLDPTYPPDRLAAMLAAADVAAVLTDRDRLDLARRLGAATPTGHSGGTGRGGPALLDLADCPPAEPVLAGGIEPDQPAYILFTSGSTGRPKGVAQTHRNVLHGVANHVRNFRLAPDDRVSVLSSFSFDMAVTDMFSAVLCGAAVVTVDIRRRGLSHLVEALAERSVSILHTTPTVYRYLCDTLGPAGRLPAVRAVVLGGEEVTRDDVERCRRHLPGAVFVNGYGATEASFAVQYHLAPDAGTDRAVVPIGYPLDGYEVLLVDGQGNRTGLLGEIAIRSRYVAPGYWRAPDLTAERFVDHADGTRTYRTRDLGRRLPDGRLTYLGRLDRQVKVRGYRVELGDIEAHLAVLPGVARGVAVVRPDGTGGNEVVAYVQPRDGASLDGAALRHDLAARLPDHLLPRVVTVVTELALTSTGKVDVAALPEPTVSVGGAAPRTATERLVAEVWSAVLGVPEVGLYDGFFALGGHSLLLAQVQTRLERATGVRVPLVRLFTQPTVAATASYVDEHGGGSVDPPPSVPDPLARIRTRMARRQVRRSVDGEGQEAVRR